VRPRRVTHEIERYRADPVSFCSEVLRFSCWSRQREILESVRDNPRTAVRSCHGPGKTATAARVALWFLSVFPHSRVVTTAPTTAQLRDVLWREIAQAHRDSRGFIGGELFGTRLEIASDWFCVGLATDRPDRFQGHHSEFLLLVIDEAAGVSEEIYEASSGFLTSPSSRVLLIGNPTKVSGEFYAAFHSQRDLYHGIAISAFDCPAFTGEKVPRSVARKLVSRKWVEEHTRKWGEGSPLWQARIAADFPSLSDDNVIALGDLEAAQQRTLEPGLPLVVSADVARFGSDETVIVVRAGNVITIAKAYSGKDTMKTVGEIVRVARDAERKHDHKPVIVVDDAGLGGGVVDRLKEQREFEVVPFLGASASKSRDYPRRRDEAWFGFAELLSGLDLPADEDLAADLLAPRYSLDSAGRRVVEPKSETKRRLRRSPDRADAAVMSFAADRTTQPIRVSRFVGGGRAVIHRYDNDADLNERLGIAVTPETMPIHTRASIADAERRALGPSWGRRRRRPG
jgi:hypothetical protein